MGRKCVNGRFCTGRDSNGAGFLYGSLLPSGAECSVTIAQLVDGGVEAFADRMNNRAAEIGMQHTHLPIPLACMTRTRFYRTDIAMLLNTALENPTFREIFTTRSYTTTSTEPIRVVSSCIAGCFPCLEIGLFRSDAAGGKTGYTDLAGQCLASLAECGGEEYILVTAGAPSNNDEDLVHIEDAVTVYGR